TSTATVSDPNVVATGGFTVTAAEGTASTVQTVATFNDPAGAEPNAADNPGGPISNHYTALINWGDGTAATMGTITPTAGNSFMVTASHIYMEEGTYTITVTIGHESSTAQVVTDTATVSNPAVVAVGGFTFSGVEGTAATGKVATFTDPGGAEATSDYSATINWGDGSPTTTGTISLSG